MVDTDKQVRASYDRLVDEYAARNDATTPSKLLPLCELLASAAGQSARVLDVGCGTGREIAWFESRGLSLSGIDTSIGMLTYARSRVNADLLLMDMTRMGFRPGSFDAVWCCASLLHVPKKDAFLAINEIHRVLKRTGMLVLVVQEGTNEGWEESYLPNAPRYFARYTKSELAGLVTSARFEITSLASMSGRDRDWLSCVALAE